MGLSFFETGSQNIKLIFTLQDEDLDALEEIIKTFNNEYNGLFDRYSDFVLYENHVDRLIRLTQTSGAGICHDFNTFLTEIWRKKVVISAIGD